MTVSGLKYLRAADILLLPHCFCCYTSWYIWLLSIIYLSNFLEYSCSFTLVNKLRSYLSKLKEYSMMVIIVHRMVLPELMCGFHWIIWNPDINSGRTIILQHLVLIFRVILSLPTYSSLLYDPQQTFMISSE